MIEQNIQVPTGNILILKGNKGFIEALSIGDYGRAQNIKADFLGFDRHLDGVANGAIEPLEKKWVITISTQYGCSMNCAFCDVPRVGAGINATLDDLKMQVKSCLSLHPSVVHTERLNLHYARMGEPTFNPDVIAHAKGLRSDMRPFIGDSLIHPVISTMMPVKNKKLGKFLADWCAIKNEMYDGDAGLQFSINSTDEEQRKILFNGSALKLVDIAMIGASLPHPKGRKYTLNFALSDTTKINAEYLSMLFDPDHFMVKITPLHATKAVVDNGLELSNGYSSYTPYEATEASLRRAGFDVLVFIPSSDEDESRITCGNAILADGRIK